MKTFILGAGASLHAGYPLATDLWSGMERWALATFPDGHLFRDAVDTMNAEFDLSKSFEIVLMNLDDRIEPLVKTRPTTEEGIREKVTLVYLRSTIKTMIPLYFNSLRDQPAELYRTVAVDLLAPGDAIITFNYDLAIDRELKRSGKWSIGNGYGFEVDIARFGDSPCKLFKLHGSTNWRGELFGGSLSFGQANSSLGERPIIDRSEFEYLDYNHASDPLCHDGRVRIESIIMPTANKKFFNETSLGREWEGFWDSLWSQAATGLSTSDEVYLIGYSIPEYDTRARDLIESKIGPRVPIEVCCHVGTDGVVESLRRAGRIGVRSARHRTFEDWIKSNANLHG